MSYEILLLLMCIYHHNEHTTYNSSAQIYEKISPYKTAWTLSRSAPPIKWLFHLQSPQWTLVFVCGKNFSAATLCLHC